MSPRSIRFARRATDDLRAAIAYSELKWGDNQSRRYEEAIWKQLDLLAYFPARGPVVGPAFGELRWVRSGRHMIYYRYNDETETIVRIQHDRLRLLPEDVE